MPLNYNTELVEKIHPVFSQICAIMVYVAIVLNILTIKWRGLVHWCLLQELIFQFFSEMIPSEKTGYAATNLLVQYYFLWIFFYTNRGPQILICTVFAFVNIYITLVFVLENGEFASAGGFIKLLIYALICFTSWCALAIVLNYIAQLQALLRKYIEQNSRLLDGMHEGLLILSKSTKKTLFFNKPA